LERFAVANPVGKKIFKCGRGGAEPKFDLEPPHPVKLAFVQTPALDARYELVEKVSFAPLSQLT